MEEASYTLDFLAERFRRFARDETVASSPLYTNLSLSIAADPDILRLARHVGKGQPIPNMLFAAVHKLLLAGKPGRLAAFYPSVSRQPVLPDDPFPAFREFCLTYEVEIISLLQTRLVQTNEVRRCACWLPAFGVVTQRANKPLALIEVGCSAGLNLLWDKYGYDYGEAGKFGDSASPVQLVSNVRGEKIPPFPATLPPIASRIGLDLNPLDLQNAEDTMWLQALLWPEHQHRAEVLQKAIHLFQAQAAPPLLIKGNALELLPQAILNSDKAAAICIYHSYTLNQFSPEMREQFWTIVAEGAKEREVYLLAMEGQRESFPTLALSSFSHGQQQVETLARCDAHGAWLEWF